jgi:uncharacterized protein YaaW (UPF0174 family)
MRSWGRNCRERIVEREHSTLNIQLSTLPLRASKCLAAFLAAALLGAALASPVRTTINLAWDYPTNELAGMYFNLYTTTNLTAPVSWSLATNVAASNLVATNLMVTVPVGPGAAFFFVTASNELGESIPSNTATAILARSVSTLKIK